jgi:WXG100 family type VII secretion target
MPAKLIRADYESLERVAKTFEQEGAAINSVNKRIKNSLEELQRGGWVGVGANKFYAEMNSSVMPPMNRLYRSLISASKSTTTIITIVQRAEEEWMRIFRTVSGAGAAAASAAAAAATGAGGVGVAAAAAAMAAATAETRGADGLIAKLGKGAKDLINQSPLLKSQLERLAKNDWRIQIGPKGGGSEADMENKIITLESGMSDKDIAQTLAHEAAHATYNAPYHAPTAKMTRSEYVRLNLQEQLRDEGQAQLNAAAVRAETLKAGGPDIGMPGTQTSKYLGVYNNYTAGKITRQQAVDQMAGLMGNEETSTSGENYKKYYGQTYEDWWDKNVAPARRRR